MPTDSTPGAGWLRPGQASFGPDAPGQPPGAFATETGDTLKNDPHTLEELQRAWKAGEESDFVFFWSHEGDALPEPGPACLSQWYPAAFEEGGQGYPTTEHFMMAEKARLFSDLQTCVRIVQAATPAEAKRLGREVRGFDTRRWDREREDVVTRGNLAKFRAHDDLARYLVGTGSRILVEASPVDAMWGIGLDEHDRRCRDPLQWPGRNLLGFVLMRVRSEISAQNTGTGD